MVGMGRVGSCEGVETNNVGSWLVGKWPERWRPHVVMVMIDIEFFR